MLIKSCHGINTKGNVGDDQSIGTIIDVHAPAECQMGFQRAGDFLADGVIEPLGDGQGVGRQKRRLLQALTDFLFGS